MATKILVRRGVVADLDQETLDEGELAFTTDELGLYVGSDSVTQGYVKVNKAGNIEYDGNALTSATDTNNLKEAVQNIDVALKTEQDNVDTLQGDLIALGDNLDSLSGSFNAHTHGTINNNGTLTAVSVAPATGDEIVIVDADDDQLKKSIAIDTTVTDKFLRQDGTWSTPADSTTLTTLGIQSSLTELNYTYGVTSNIQTQLNNKAASSHTHTKSQITDFAHTHTKSEITDFAHTHTEADVTDLDKYTQAQTDTLLDAKVDQTDYDTHRHLTERTFLGSVSSEDLPNAVNYTMTVNIFSNTILLYSTQNPTPSNAAGNLGTLWLNIQTGNVYRLENIISVAPPNYQWQQVGSVIGWSSITALDPNIYYGFNSTYWALQDGANPSQGTFLYVPNINAIQITISKNNIALLMIKYRYYDSVADKNIDQVFTVHPRFIGWEDINDVYSIRGYNSGFVEISAQFLTGGVYNIILPMPADANDIQQISFYGIKTTPVTVTSL